MKKTLIHGAIFALFSSPLYAAVTLLPGDTYSGNDPLVTINGGGSSSLVTIENASLDEVISNDAALNITDTTMLTLRNNAILADPDSVTTLNRVQLQVVFNNGNLNVTDALNTVVPNDVLYINSATGSLSLNGQTNIYTLTNNGIVYNQSTEEIHDITSTGEVYNGANGNIWAINSAGKYESAGNTTFLQGSNLTNNVFLMGDSTTESLSGVFNVADISGNSIIERARLYEGTINVYDNAKIKNFYVMEDHARTLNLFSGSIDGMDVDNLNFSFYSGKLGTQMTDSNLRGSTLNVLQSSPVLVDGRLYLRNNSIFYAENPNAVYLWEVGLSGGSTGTILGGDFRLLGNTNATVSMGNDTVIQRYYAGNGVTTITGDVSIDDASFYLGTTTISDNVQINTLDIESDEVGEALLMLNGGEIQTLTSSSYYDPLDDPTILATQVVINNATVHNLDMAHTNIMYNSGVMGNVTLSQYSTFTLGAPLTLNDVSLTDSRINIGGDGELTMRSLVSDNGHLDNINVNLNNPQSEAKIIINEDFSGNLTLGLNASGVGSARSKVLLVELLNDSIWDETVSVSGADINVVSGIQVSGLYQINSSPYLWDTVRTIDGWYLQTTPLFTPSSARSITAPSITALSTTQSITGGIGEHMGKSWEADMGQNIWGHMTWDNDVVNVTNTIQVKNDMRGFDVGVDVVNTEHGGWGLAASYRGMHHTIEQSDSGLTNSMQNDSTALVGTLYGRYQQDAWEQKGQLFAGQVWSNQNYDNGQDSYKGTIYGLDYEVGYRLRNHQWSMLPYVGVQMAHSQVGESYQSLQGSIGVNIDYQDDNYTWTLSPKLRYDIDHTKTMTLSDNSTLSYETSKLTYGVDIGIAKDNALDSWFIKLGSRNLKENAWTLSLGGSVKF